MTAKLSGIQISPETEVDRREKFITEHNSCELCGTHFNFHIRHLSNGQIHEEAICPSCGVITRSKIHKMH